MILIQDLPSGASFAVRIQPRAKNNAKTGQLGNVLKIMVTSPPMEGRANDACIRFLARLLAVPPSSVTIAAGQNSRNKVIRVRGLSAQQVRDRLDI